MDPTPIEGQTGATPAVPERPLPVVPDGDYNEAGVPSFDYVRDRIESRVATAIGSQELAEETPQGRTIDQQLVERDKAGKERLEQIRRSMREE